MAKICWKCIVRICYKDAFPLYVIDVGPTNSQINKELYLIPAHLYDPKHYMYPTILWMWLSGYLDFYYANNKEPDKCKIELEKALGNFLTRARNGLTEYLDILGFFKFKEDCIELITTEKYSDEKRAYNHKCIPKEWEDLFRENTLFTKRYNVQLFNKRDKWIGNALGYDKDNDKLTCLNNIENLFTLYQLSDNNDLCLKESILTYSEYNLNKPNEQRTTAKKHAQENFLPRNIVESENHIGNPCGYIIKLKEGRYHLDLISITQGINNIIYEVLSEIEEEVYEELTTRVWDNTIHENAICIYPSDNLYKKLYVKSFLGILQAIWGNYNGYSIMSNGLPYSVKSTRSEIDKYYRNNNIDRGREEKDYIDPLSKEDTFSFIQRNMSRYNTQYNVAPTPLQECKDQIVSPYSLGMHQVPLITIFVYLHIIASKNKGSHLYNLIKHNLIYDIKKISATPYTEDINILLSNVTYSKYENYNEFVNINPLPFIKTEKLYELIGETYLWKYLQIITTQKEGERDSKHIVLPITASRLANAINDIETAIIQFTHLMCREMDKDISEETIKYNKYIGFGLEEMTEYSTMQNALYHWYHYQIDSRENSKEDSLNNDFINHAIELEKDSIGKKYSKDVHLKNLILRVHQRCFPIISNRIRYALEDRIYNYLNVVKNILEYRLGSHIQPTADKKDIASDNVEFSLVNKLLYLE